jgi:hypothetical protein
MAELITFFVLLNSVVWLAISVLLLYNLFLYTRDKAQLDNNLTKIKDMFHMGNPFMKGYLESMGIK